jgi:hypothetical protein
MPLQFCLSGNTSLVEALKNLINQRTTDRY